MVAWFVGLDGDVTVMLVEMGVVLLLTAVGGLLLSAGVEEKIENKLTGSVLPLTKHLQNVHQ